MGLKKRLKKMYKIEKVDVLNCFEGFVLAKSGLILTVCGPKGIDFVAVIKLSGVSERYILKLKSCGVCKEVKSS
jgi:hypothetical protein